MSNNASIAADIAEMNRLMKVYATFDAESLIAKLLNAEIDRLSDVIDAALKVETPDLVTCLIPAGGMALTAEQVEDVEALVATANPYSAPAARLRALFPATEPAEEVKPVHPRPDVGDWGYGGGAAVYAPEVRGKTREELLSEKVEQLQAQVKHLSRVAVNAAEHGIKAPSGSLKPCGSNSVTLGWCKLTARHEGLHTNGTYLWGTPSEPDPPAPAEPAEERCQSVSIFRERCALVPGHDGRHAANGCAWGYPPAPAEPAEEETKAEASAIEAGMSLVDWDLIPERGDPNEAAYVAARGAVKAYAANRFEAGFQDLSALIERLVADARSSGHYNDPSKLAGYAEGIEHAYLALAASSPVVPAPTETGPWQTPTAIPVGVPFRDKEGSEFVKLADGTFGYLKVTRETRKTLAEYAPFVAAKEGDA